MLEITYPAACKHCAYCIKKPNGKRSILTCSNVISPKHKQVITAKDYCPRFALQAEAMITYQQDTFQAAAILRHTKTLEYIYITGVEGELVRKDDGYYYDDEGKAFKPPYKEGEEISAYVIGFPDAVRKIATLKVLVKVEPVALLSITDDEANNVMGLNEPNAREIYLERLYHRFGAFDMPAYLWAVHFTATPLDAPWKTNETSN